eukprot:m.95081 g.95081  ORF g.95081 m.95081 type:complete len:959 (-) comp15438_c0_seq5:287-3163(-)
MSSSSSASDYFGDETVAERLIDVLYGVERPGSFYSTGSRETALPTIEIAGVGRLGFPLSEQQAKAIEKVATRAPYGRGADTVVDETVRKVWQVAPGQLTAFRGVGWEKALADIVSTVSHDLGCESVGKISATLYKVLLYDKGGFFTKHRDTEKEDGMFGTLVISLPSKHTGGDLVLEHEGIKVSLNLGTDESAEVKFAAFYADCEHEVLPIESGYRLCLVYNLVRPAGCKSLTVPDESERVAQAAKALQQWSSSAQPQPPKFLLPLDHKYSAAALSWAGLKGRDAALAAVFDAAAAQANCGVGLAIIHVEERWDDQGCERLDSWMHLFGFRTETGPVPGLSRLDLREDEDSILPSDAFDDVKPVKETYHEATGNEGVSLERCYMRAALVIWPAAHTDNLFLGASTQNRLARLGDMATILATPSPAASAASAASADDDAGAVSADKGQAGYAYEYLGEGEGEDKDTDDNEESDNDEYDEYDDEDDEVWGWPSAKRRRKGPEDRLAAFYARRSAGAVAPRVSAAAARAAQEAKATAGAAAAAAARAAAAANPVVTRSKSSSLLALTRGNVTLPRFHAYALALLKGYTYNTPAILHEALRAGDAELATSLMTKEGQGITVSDCGPLVALFGPDKAQPLLMEAIVQPLSRSASPKTSIALWNQLAEPGTLPDAHVEALSEKLMPALQQFRKVEAEPTYYSRYDYSSKGDDPAELAETLARTFELLVRRSLPRSEALLIKAIAANPSLFEPETVVAQAVCGMDPALRAASKVAAQVWGTCAQKLLTLDFIPPPPPSDFRRKVPSRTTYYTSEMWQLAEFLQSPTESTCSFLGNQSNRKNMKELIRQYDLDVKWSEEKVGSRIHFVCRKTNRNYESTVAACKANRKRAKELMKSAPAHATDPTIADLVRRLRAAASAGAEVAGAAGAAGSASSSRPAPAAASAASAAPRAQTKQPPAVIDLTDD